MLSRPFSPNLTLLKSLNLKVKVQQGYYNPHHGLTSKMLLFHSYSWRGYWYEIICYLPFSVDLLMFCIIMYNVKFRIVEQPERTKGQ